MEARSRYPEVISIGNMLVEIMRTGLDQPLDRAGDFTGPYPSGDTPIYIDTVARLGHSCGFIGAVGQDSFGDCLMNRLRDDGVDTSEVRVLPDRTTGVAFVAYFSGGNRRFIYHWKDAAAGQVAPEYIDPSYLMNARWLHITGCNLAVNASARDACYRAVDLLPEGATLSFDPNIRPEILSVDEIIELCKPVLERANVFLPSSGEGRMFAGTADDEAGCRWFAERGKTVVLKQGAEGCRVFTSATEFHAPGFSVTEVDPTGAGDSFCAGFTVGMLEGMSLPDAARFANATGALAVTKQGPMEGAPWRADVDAFLAHHPSR